MTIDRFTGNLPPEQPKTEPVLNKEDVSNSKFYESLLLKKDYLVDIPSKHFETFSDQDKAMWSLYEKLSFKGRQTGLLNDFFYGSIFKFFNICKIFKNY